MNFFRSPWTGNIGIILGGYIGNLGGNGKENGKYYLGFRV